MRTTNEARDQIELCSFQDKEDDGQALLGDEDQTMRSPLLLQRDPSCLFSWWRRALVFALLLVTTVWVCSRDATRQTTPPPIKTTTSHMVNNGNKEDSSSFVARPSGWLSRDDSVDDDDYDDETYRDMAPPNATFVTKFHKIGTDVVIGLSTNQGSYGWDPPTFVPGTTKLALSGNGTKLAMSSNFPAAATPYGGGGNVVTSHWFQGSFGGSSPLEPVATDVVTEDWRQGHFVVQPGDRSFQGVNVALSADGTRLVQSTFHSEEHLRLDYGTPFRRGHVQTLQWDDHQHQWSKAQPILLEDPWCPPWGLSVAVSGDGNRVAIGSPFGGSSDDKASHDTNGWCQKQANNASGVVYIYDYNLNKGDWEKTAELEASSTGLLFGQTVSLSRNGSRLVVGFGVDSDGDMDDSYCNLGQARVFDWSAKDKEWNQVGHDIVGYDRGCWGIHDGIKAEISLDGNRIAVVGVAAPTSVGVPTTYLSGHAQVFELSDDQEWVEMGSYVDGDYDVGSSDGEDHMYFGGSMAMTEDGGRIVIGALSRDLRDVPLGHVRVFDWNPETLHWDQVAPDIDSEVPQELYFGANVAISSDGNRIAASFSRASEMGHVTNHVRTFQSGDL